uniref:Hylaserpin S1 n=1 Tax=Hyla simplex TaxID=334658 RepID=H6SWK9_9NEOB|nr:hylaserpin S1 [Hyla simplex]
MKLFTFLCLSHVLLCTLVCGHHGGPHDHDDHDHDDHDHDDHDEAKALSQVAQSNIHFCYKLYQHLAAAYPNDNIFYSPLSISMAFSLLSLGANAKTLTQIREGFGFNTSLVSEETIHEGFKQLLYFIHKPERNLNLNIANALFIDNKQKLLEKFLDGAKKWYHTEAISTDFLKAAEAVKQINSYVEKNTNGKIAELLDSVDQDAIFVFINYIYFRGKWENPFNKERTQEGDFHVNENTIVKVPFMHRTGMYLVAFTDEATVVSIPYKGDAGTLFILPKEGKFSEVEQNLHKESIVKWKNALHEGWVDLSLPKFSVSGTINLKETLSKMGIVDVFSDQADLSGIAEEANVKISKAVHKAVLSVDEKGTEAAGSTAIEISPTMILPSVNFNHPFLFLMYDLKTKSVLFAGKIINPQK